MAKRIASYGRDYPPAWCNLSLYYTDVASGETTEDVACVYCGDRATDSEHVVPWSWFSKVVDSRDETLWTWLVPACSECNGLASDQMFPSPVAKRRYIRERLRARYHFAFLGEPWTAEEMAELGPGLGQFVRASQAQAENVRARVLYRGLLPPGVGSLALDSEVKRIR